MLTLREISWWFPLKDLAIHLKFNNKDEDLLIKTNHNWDNSLLKENSLEGKYWDKMSLQLEMKTVPFMWFKRENRRFVLMYGNSSN
jgi:hypothetical protein